jgi:hypothetical protein
MSLFEHLFKGLSLYMEARIWFRIRINVMQIHNTAYGEIILQDFSTQTGRCVTKCC